MYYYVNIYITFEHNSFIGLIKSYLIFSFYLHSYGKLCFVELICKFDKITSQFKSLFTYINKLVNICAKVCLDSIIRLKIIYIKCTANMIIYDHFVT